MKIPGKVYSVGRTSVGIPTGATFRCRLEGCTGRRITVKWPDGKITHPCSKGMRFSPEGNVAELE